MKKIFKLTLAVALVLMSVATASAQKFGRVDVNAIIPNMPQYQEAIVKYEEFAKDLGNQYEMMQVEFNQKYADYQKNMNTYNDPTRQDKEAELQSLSERLNSFQQMAQQSIQQKEIELMTPIEEKAFEAINKVAKEGGYLVIFNTANNQPRNAGLAYFDEEALIDITADVKKSLGIE